MRAYNAFVLRCASAGSKGSTIFAFAGIPSIPRFIPIEEVVSVKVTAQEIAQYGCFLWLSSNLSYT